MRLHCLTVEVFGAQHFDIPHELSHLISGAKMESVDLLLDELESESHSSKTLCQFSSRPIM